MDSQKQSIIMANIDLLLQQNNEKVSHLENALNVGKGYISRLRNNKVGISLDLLERVSKHFHVSIDYLLHESSSTSVTENLLVGFFETIYQSDCNGQLYWRQAKINDPHYDEDKPLGPADTIIEQISEHDDEMYPEYIIKALKPYSFDDDQLFGIHWIGALSLGQGRSINGIKYSRAELTGDYFYTNINKDDLSFFLYLYKVRYFDEDKNHQTEDLIEAYIDGETGSHYLCNSLESGNYLNTKLNDLYIAAINKSSSNKLDEPALSLLRRFTAINKIQ